MPDEEKSLVQTDAETAVKLDVIAKTLEAINERLDKLENSASNITTDGDFAARLNNVERKIFGKNFSPAPVEPAV